MNMDYSEADLLRDQAVLVATDRMFHRRRCPYCAQKLPDGFSRELKECSRCHRELSISLYSKNKQARGGLRSECKMCAKQYQAVYRSKHPHKVWAQGIVANRKRYGYTIKIVAAELEVLAKATPSCGCGRVLDWTQGSLHHITCKSKDSPHLVMASRIITINSIRIMCKGCAELAWKRITLSEKEILDIEPQITEQKPTKGVVTMKMNFFPGDAE